MDILLLHGAIGSATQLAPLQRVLEQNHRVFSINFSGHGGQASNSENFGIALFASDVLAFLDANSIGKITIFGYSMGGYVAMYLAKHHPERIDRIITLATKYNWDEAIAAREVQMLNPDKISEKLPAFAETLTQRHAPADWKDVLHKTATMMLQMGADNPIKTIEYNGITHPTLVVLGDRDKMVTLEETVAVYKALPNAQLCVLPRTPHPIEQVNVELLTTVVEEFLKGQ